MGGWNPRETERLEALRERVERHKSFQLMPGDIIVVKQQNKSKIKLRLRAGLGFYPLKKGDVLVVLSSMSDGRVDLFTKGNVIKAWSGHLFTELVDNERLELLSIHYDETCNEDVSSKFLEH